MQKLMINLWKILNKESSYLKYLDVNSLYGWPISQKLPVNDFVLIEEKVEKVEKLVTDLHDKTEYVVRIRNLKEVLNPGLIFEKGS